MFVCCVCVCVCDMFVMRSRVRACVARACVRVCVSPCVRVRVCASVRPCARRGVRVQVHAHVRGQACCREGTRGAGQGQLAHLRRAASAMSKKK